MKSKLDKTLMSLIETLRRMAESIIRQKFLALGGKKTGLVESDELVNEAILYYLKNKKRLKNHPNLRGYLIKKMRSLYIDQIRKSKRFVQLNPDKQEQKQAIFNKSLIKLSHEEQTFDTVTSVAMYLQFEAKRICRQILRLWMKGYKTSEMAKKIGIKKGTVLSRLYNCRKNMIEYVTGEKLPI